MNHLDDDAELYALGLTDRERDAEIEAHLAACDACRARVVAAESAAASLAATLPPIPAAAPRRTWWAPLATAAAFVFAATTALQTASLHSESARLARADKMLVFSESPSSRMKNLLTLESHANSAPLHAIAASHFGHTTLASQPGVIAKALYARDGGWLYVIAENVPVEAHVVLRDGAASRDLGAFAAGAPATLFVRKPGRANEIEIVVGPRVVAHGAPAY